MTIDRTPKPCRHKQARHVHGHRNTYVLDRCRCLPCCYAASVYEQQRVRRNAYGRPNLIDAAPARDHVQALTAAGIGLKTIVKRSGVSQGALCKLMYGKRSADGTTRPSRRVTRSTAERLLALQPDDRALAADGAKVDATGTRRRLQALACLGWSTSRIARESGLDRQRLDRSMNCDQVMASTARAVAAVYEQMWNRRSIATNSQEQGGITRTLRAAAAAGWAPPAAWDDDIDDPAARPAGADNDHDLVDELAIARVLTEGHRLQLTGVTLHAAVHALTDAGHQPATIADRVGCGVRQVERLRARPDAPKQYRRAA